MKSKNTFRHELKDLLVVSLFQPYLDFLGLLCEVTSDDHPYPDERFFAALILFFVVALSLLLIYAAVINPAFVVNSWILAEVCYVVVRFVAHKRKRNSRSIKF